LAYVSRRLSCPEESPARAGSCVLGGLCRKVASNALHNLLASLCQVSAEANQDLSSQPFAFPDQGKQDVFSSDPGMAQVSGLVLEELDSPSWRRA
jgi:hypothetical protein